MRRREVIALLGGAAAAWPLKARAQQPGLPVVAFLRTGSPDGSARFVTQFNKGLNETGYVDGQNVKVDYHWLEDQYDLLPALMADLVRRHARSHARCACGQSCHNDDTDRLRCHPRPGPTWSCCKPRPARR